MPSIVYGTEKYGRVKTVDGTPIVTTFAMLQAMPVYPLQSFYFLGDGPTTRSGVPFLASSTSTTIHGVALANIDKASVTMAYARAISCVLMLIGGLAFLMVAVKWLTGDETDPGAGQAAAKTSWCLLIGAVGGAVTYAVPLTSARNHSIRHFCGELLGVSVDPAAVEPATGERLLAFAREQPVEPGSRRAALIRELIATRAMIATTRDRQELEARTDDIVARLQRDDGIPA